MSGGNLVVAGDCGPFAGSAMSGGRLEIGSDAGGFLAAPLEGEMEGMTGGLLIVRGNAGERAGDRLRRGTIVIEGSAGDFPGSRMIAGTLIVLKDCGTLPGYLMRRGTIILANPPELAPTFADCGIHELAFTSVFSGLLRAESRAAARLLGRPLARSAGDMAALGKGEMFVPAYAGAARIILGQAHFSEQGSFNAWLTEARLPSREQIVPPYLTGVPVSRALGHAVHPHGHIGAEGPSKRKCTVALFDAGSIFCRPRFCKNFFGDGA